MKRPTRVVHPRWASLNDALARQATARHPEAFVALRLLQRHAARHEASRAYRHDPLLLVHAAAINTAWKRLAADGIGARVSRSLVGHGHRAFAAGDERGARTILKTLGRRQPGAPDSPQEALASLLQGALAVQGAQHAEALRHLERARIALPADAGLQALLHHLTGVCHAKTARWPRALAHLELTLVFAEDAARPGLLDQVRIDLALAQARLGSPALADTLDALTPARDATTEGGTDRYRVLLQQRMCAFAGSGHMGLVTFLSKATFQDSPGFHKWTADTFPALHDAGGAGPALQTINAILSIVDRHVDLTGITGVLFPESEARELGLQHPLADRSQDFSQHLTEDNAWDMVLTVLRNAPRNPHIADAAMSCGEMFCMFLQLMGMSALAHFASQVLEAIARMRGATPPELARIIMQRGFFLLQEGRPDAARQCFAAAYRRVVGTGVPWREELARALLGIGLCRYVTGDLVTARRRLWESYVMARVSTDSSTDTWRCAAALSRVLGLDTEGRRSSASVHASLLMDKLSIDHLLSDVRLDTDRALAGAGEWFPALRQAISTLVGLRRLTEAEMLRDLARSLQTDRLAPPRTNVPPSPGSEATGADARPLTFVHGSVLSGAERAALQAAGLHAVEQDIVRLRALVGAHGTSGMTREGPRPPALREIAALWKALPDRLEQALADASARLASSVEPMATSKAFHDVRPPPLGGHARIGYIVQPDRLVITLEQAEDRWACEVPVGGEELNRAVFSVRASCSDANAPLERACADAKRLYQLLIAPVRARLEAAGTHTVDVSPHQFLDLVPYSALWDGESFMAERFAWSLRHPGIAPRTAPAPWDASTKIRLLGVADFGGRAPALEGVQRELHRIRADAGPARAHMWLNEAMTARAFKQAVDDPETGVLHIATHASFDPHDERRSVLTLGDHTELGVAEIRHLVAARPLRLLVLAACNTAKSAPDLDSIASAFLRAGVQGVLATQWPLNDASASWLMPLFYRRLFAGAATPAQALREAQCLFMKGDLATQRWRTDPADIALPDETARRHPRLWSPYTLFQ